MVFVIRLSATLNMMVQLLRQQKHENSFRLPLNSSNFCFVADESEITLHHDLSTIPSSLLTAEREEAKAVLTLFLRKQGLSNTVSARIINKSDRFIDHLILKLQSIHKSRYLVGSIKRDNYSLHSKIFLEYLRLNPD